MCAAGDFEKGDPGQRIVVTGAALAGNGYLSRKRWPGTCWAFVLWQGLVAWLVRHWP